MAYRGLLALTVAAGALLTPVGSEAAQCTDDVVIVFDGSGSMAEAGFNQLDEPRIFAARRAVRESVPEVAPFRRLGLVTYGPGAGGECSNVDLRFRPLPNAASRVIAEIDGLQPEGGTPLTDAVRMAAEVLDYRRKSGAIVLVTDGKETCGGAPCQLAATLAGEAEDLTVHVIGFKVRGDYFSWESQGAEDYRNGVTVARCLADRTGGLYLDTETAPELAQALRDTIGCQLIGQTDRPAALPVRG